MNANLKNNLGHCSSQRRFLKDFMQAVSSKFHKVFCTEGLIIIAKKCEARRVEHDEMRAEW